MKPIIFVATAQDLRNPLYNLPAERRGIRKALRKLIDDDVCELIELANLTLDDLYDTFNEPRHRERICIFHYAGHADQWELLLEDDKRESSSASGTGLISFLARQTALQLVFFNGCNTDQLAEALVREGVPLVIGTVKAISDNVARDLAIQFYSSLAGGNTITTAWEDAKDKALAKHGTDTRSLYQFEDDSLSISSPQRPWRLFERPEATLAKQQSLVTLGNNPLAFLPSLPESIDWPDDPFPGMRPFARKDARIFFGRSRVIWELYQAIRHANSNPLLLLYGQSGVGKSSVLAAGLLPRLEEHYLVYEVRSQPQLTIRNSLLQRFNASPEESLSEAWNRVAQQALKPLIIIIDQVEEIFNDPDNDGREAFKNLLTSILQIFPPGGPPRPGKVILSYRKEVHADVTRIRQELGMPAREFLLSPLDKDGIIEAVQSLEQSRLPTSAPLYHIELDPELPTALAFDLLEDSKSAIAPILQIVLAQLWEEARQQDQQTRLLTLDAYLRLKSKAGDRSRLERYFLDQLEELKTWNEEVVQSGLVLDLLYFHTSSAASQQRTYQQILERYSDRQELVRQLLDKIKEAYLMADNPSLGEKAEPAVVLIHDILVPLIRSKYQESTRPWAVGGSDRAQ